MGGILFSKQLLGWFWEEWGLGVFGGQDIFEHLSPLDESGVAGTWSRNGDGAPASRICEEIIMSVHNKC